MTKALPRAAIAEAFVAACKAELRALKPGNVHIFAAGHRMQVKDFEISAEAAAPHIANPRLSVGARIRRSIDATVDAVGCNTNLGIVLLAAPLAAAAVDDPAVPLQRALSAVLAGLTQRDAADAFAAISRANPAGLGQAKEADVAAPARVSLREAMALAARRDRIARAYVTDYADIFDFGLPRLAKAHASGAPDDAVTALHMAYLARFPDSHITRKHGAAVARSVKDAARANVAFAMPPISPAARSKLLEFDRNLKAQGLNPGTSADLVVATLFAEALISRRAALGAR